MLLDHLSRRRSISYCEHFQTVVRPSVYTFEPLDQFSWNFMWGLVKEGLKKWNVIDHKIVIKIEGEITEDEIAHVLKNMKNNKSPGSDGFTVEFFKFFFKDLKTFIKCGINEGYSMCKFSITQRQGIITCIPKGDKPRHVLKNWRPITLLICILIRHSFMDLWFWITALVPWPQLLKRYLQNCLRMYC